LEREKKMAMKEIDQDWDNRLGVTLHRRKEDHEKKLRNCGNTETDGQA
jgi:hypothetical protein